MKNILKKKIPHIIIPILLALLSIFVLSKHASSVSFHQGSLKALQEKQTTVLELSAASASASAAITLIPGDTAEPIADKLADLSSHFLLVLSAIFLEKYLLTITGTVTFSILIPAACLLYILYTLFHWKAIALLALKITVFGLLIFSLIPASIHLSNLIEDTYQNSIDTTLKSAKETTDEIKNNVNGEKDDDGLFSEIFATVTNGVSNFFSSITNKIETLINNFIEALAVMLVTCCAIPVLVLLSFVWLAKVILSVDIPFDYNKTHRRLKDNLRIKKHKDPHQS